MTREQAIKQAEALCDAAEAVTEFIRLMDANCAERGVAMLPSVLSWLSRFHEALAGAAEDFLTRGATSRGESILAMARQFDDVVERQRALITAVPLPAPVERRVLPADHPLRGLLRVALRHEFERFAALENAWLNKSVRRDTELWAVEREQFYAGFRAKLAEAIQVYADSAKPVLQIDAEKAADSWLAESAAGLDSLESLVDASRAPAVVRETARHLITREWPGRAKRLADWLADSQSA